MKNILSFFLITLLISGCEVDNFEPPSLTLSGKIIDSETNELVESGGINAGSVVKLYQDSSIQPLIFSTFPDGKFMNSRVFPGNYRYTAEGPFKMVDNHTATLALRNNAEIEIKVVANVRLKASLVRKSDTTAVIKLSYKKVLADLKLMQLAVVWSTAANPNLFTFSGGNVVIKDVQTLNLVSGEEEFTITKLKPHTVYYVRAGASTNSPGNYYNYSTQFELKD